MKTLQFLHVQYVKLDRQLPAFASPLAKCTIACLKVLFVEIKLLGLSASPATQLKPPPTLLVYPQPPYLIPFRDEFCLRWFFITALRTQTLKDIVNLPAGPTVA